MASDIENFVYQKWSNKSDVYEFAGTPPSTLKPSKEALGFDQTNKKWYTWDLINWKLVDDAINRLLVLESDRGYLSTKLIGSTDLNNLLTNGFYMGDNLTNAPEGSNIWFYVKIIDHNGSYIYQEAIPLHQAMEYRVYGRRMVNGTWESWQRIPTMDKVYSLSDRNVQIYNTPAVNVNSYTQGAIELRTTDGSCPIIGFHRYERDAVALYQTGGKLRVNSINGSIQYDLELALTQVSNVTTYYNAWSGDIYFCKVGNIVIVRGWMQSGTSSDGTMAFAIPNGMTPSSSFSKMSFYEGSNLSSNTWMLSINSGGFASVGSIKVGGALNIDCSYIL